MPVELQTSIFLFRQYRHGVSGQILMNLCVALIFSLLVFVVGIKEEQNETACIAVAVCLHYFVLVAVLWMGIEALHMFIIIVRDRVHEEFGKRFVIKCAVAAWGRNYRIICICIILINVLLIFHQHLKVNKAKSSFSLGLPLLIVLTAVLIKDDDYRNER